MFNKLPAELGSDLDMWRRICVDFGSAGYSRDGVTLWHESSEDYDDCPAVSDVEKLAKESTTEHDWRIFFFAPLYDAEYQRQGDGIWVLVKSGIGFA